MATAAIFSSLRRRRSPSLEAFLAPVDLSGIALVKTLASISSEVVSSFAATRFSFQRRNARSLLRKIEIFVVLFEFLAETRSPSSSTTALLCLKEFYLLIYRSKILLEYAAQSSKLWLLLQNPSISGYFHDLNQEISTLLDVFPVNELNLSDDIREHIKLLQNQSLKSRLYIDKNDESLRETLYSRYRELAEDLVVLPAHFMIIDELNEDGTVARRLGDLFKENHGLNIEDEAEFRRTVTDNLPPQPNAYEQIRQVNMGKITPNNDEQTEMEIGPNRCAVR